ncbi:MAG: zf-HC2 domain-containing protein [candidate division KSB1 bacterium]|nr:zf-HC2 domain-containing protein [candidate division KSB1 bacterium]MDZ7385511.1 zf-HC2 domain-containing protein [candidate division KSB1 bacterium]MDZ7393302.1 zf-HC2 domain-containing protein [candidate division KSB1 bacterium]MDZ7413162.1 zf-HC2 domain-containing protein [candidate division KSB1 bacterium]
MSARCLHKLDEICAALDEELDSEQCRMIRAHLEECPQCCAVVDSLRKTVRLFQCLPKADVPEEVDLRLWKVLKLEKPQS